MCEIFVSNTLYIITIRNNDISTCFTHIGIHTFRKWTKPTEFKKNTYIFHFFNMRTKKKQKISNLANVYILVFRKNYWCMYQYDNLPCCDAWKSVIISLEDFDGVIRFLLITRRKNLWTLNGVLDFNIYITICIPNGKDFHFKHWIGKQKWMELSIEMYAENMNVKSGQCQARQHFKHT